MSANYREPQFLLPNCKNLKLPGTGTSVGSGLTEDRHSLYSMDFNGNNHISCETITQLGNLTQATWSGWFKRSNTGSYYIMGSWGTSPGDRQFLVLQSPTALTVYMAVGQQGNQKTMFQNTSLTFTIGEWYHLVFVYNESEASNADKMKVYINNFIQTNESVGNAINFVNPVTVPFMIGTIGGYLTNKFQGQIDEVAIFSRALSLNEVNDLWNGGSPSNPMLLSGKPVAYYPLGEQARNPNGSSDWRFPNEVLQGQVINFDGTDHISTGLNLGYDNVPTWTISYWIKCDSASFTNYHNYYAIGVDVAGAAFNYAAGRLYKDGAGLKVYAQGSSNISGSTILNDGQWHNIIQTYVDQGSNVQTTNIYVDGNPTPEVTVNTLYYQKLANDLFIGFRNAGSAGSSDHPFIGEVSNVVVWKSDQSANITNIYNYGAPQTSYTTTPTAWYKLDKTSTFTGLNANWHSALSFDSGQSDYIALGTGIGNELGSSYNGVISISTWFYFNGTWNNSINDGIIQIGGNLSNNYGKIAIYGAAQSLYVDTSNNSGSKVSAKIANVNHAPYSFSNRWVHLTVVWDLQNSNNSKIYVDGSVVDLTQAGNLNNWTTDTIDFTNKESWIGVYFNPALATWNGLISNTAIFKQAISAEDVKYLYNGGTPQTNISFEPLSWYKLHNTGTGIQDSGSGSNDGTNNGTTEVTSNVAVDEWVFDNVVQSQTPNWTSALDFGEPNTGGENVNVPVDIGGLTKCSVSVWFKTPNPDARQAIYATGGNNGNFHFYFWDTGSGILYAGVNNIYAQNNTVNTLIPFDKWTHLSIVYNGTFTDSDTAVQNAGRLKMYINSSYVPFTAFNSTIPASISSAGSTNINIGSYGATTYEFGGQLSNFNIYNTNLSQSEINSLYNNGQPPTTLVGSPIGSYALDSTTITDSSGNGNTGTNNGATEIQTNVWTPRLNGESDTLPSTALVSSDLQFNSAYSSFSMLFDAASGDYIDSGTSLFTDSTISSISISCWVKLPASNNFTGAIISKDQANSASHGGTSAKNRNFLLQFSSSDLFWQTSPTTSGTALQNLSVAQSAYDVVDGNWHNIVVTYEAGSTSGTAEKLIYIDGQLKATDPQASLSSIHNNTSVPIEIGRRGDAVRYFDGNIDEVAIFNKKLNLAEITSIYNNGYPKDITALAPVSWYRLGENAYFNGNDFIIPNQITGAANGTSNGMPATALVADAPGSYAAGLGSLLALDDRLGDAPLSTANSLSFNMTPENRISYAAGYAPPQVDNIYIMNFDAATSTYINTGSTPSDLNLPYSTVTNSDFSLSFWYYFDVNENYDPIIQATSHATNGFGVWQSSTNTSSLNFWVGHYSSGSLYTSQLTAQVWYHIACVFEGGATHTQKIYVNGVQNNTASYTTSRTIHSGQNCLIGGQTFQNRYFDGKLDEFAIFDYALSARQIKQDIYNATTSGKTADLNNNSNLTPPVAWYRMGD